MSETADVVIIGGGIMGSATAYFLAMAKGGGNGIVVLEPDPTYAKASTPKATGIVRQQYGVPENIRMCVFAAEFLKAAPHLLATGEEPVDFGFRERGYVWLLTPDILTVVQAMHATQLENGADVAFLDPQALAAWLPHYRIDGLAGGMRGMSGAGWLDPWGFLQAFKKKALALGVTYVKDRAVGLSVQGRRVTTVMTAEGRVYAPGQVINCAGALGAAQICALVGLPLPVEPRKRSQFVLDVREDVRGFPMTVYPKNGVWFRPEGRNILCGVAPPADRDPPTDDLDVDHELFEEIIWPTLAELVPAFEAVKVVNTYAGLYDFNTLDENAIIGRPPSLDNFLIATGFSGHGVMQAPATGRAISEQITVGRFTTLDLTRFGYERILSGAALPEPACF